jgi:hypothetical protein
MQFALTHGAVRNPWAPYFPASTFDLSVSAQQRMLWRIP